MCDFCFVYRKKQEVDVWTLQFHLHRPEPLSSVKQYQQWWEIVTAFADSFSSDSNTRSYIFLYLNRWRLNVQEWLWSAESRDLSHGDVVWWGGGGFGGGGLVKKRTKITKSFTEKMSKSTQIKKWIKELDFIFNIWLSLVIVLWGCF